MNLQRILTPADAAFITIFSLATSIFASMTGVAPDIDSDFGICFPAPPFWNLIPEASGFLNILLIFATAACVFLTNRKFSMIQGAQPLWASLFLPLCCGNLMMSGALSSAAPAAALTLLAIYSLLDTYGRRNATRSIFLIATYLSIGSMFQRAFLVFIIPLALSLPEIKTARIKEFLALLFGLVTPYWIAVAFGLTRLGNFHMAPLEPIFSSHIGGREFVMVIGSGVALTSACMLTLYNGLKLYAGNTRIRNCNNVVNFFGVTAAAGMIVDFSNIMAYAGVFNLWVALQLANLLTLHPQRHPHFLFRTVILIIAIFSIIMALV